MEDLLKEWQTTRLNTPAAARVVVLANGRIGYAEPLYTMPLCVNCHGQNLKPEVAQQIKKLYPDDQATGFHAGDLRGLLWVEFSR